jgi:xanthine dehydrogenase accessory factor
MMQRVLNVISEDLSGRLPEPNGDLFAQVFNPSARLIVIGAVHISQALAPMAALAGYAVTVIDPRRAFATDERFPGVTLLNEWPDDGLEALKPDRRTAVVTLTHDPKLDDAALSVALKSQCFYVGSLGSRKTHQARLNRLKRLGFSEAELARIHGPVGLSIGALTPAEIAVSILGQITQVRRARPEPESAPKSAAA